MLHEHASCGDKFLPHSFHTASQHTRIVRLKGLRVASWPQEPVNFGIPAVPLRAVDRTRTGDSEQELWHQVLACGAVVGRIPNHMHGATFLLFSWCGRMFRKKMRCAASSVSAAMKTTLRFFHNVDCAVYPKSAFPASPLFFACIVVPLPVPPIRSRFCSTDSRPAKSFASQHCRGARVFSAPAPASCAPLPMRPPAPTRSTTAPGLWGDDGGRIAIWGFSSAAPLQSRCHQLDDAPNTGCWLRGGRNENS